MKSPSRYIRWFVLLTAVILISVTYLVSVPPGKVQVNAEALQLFAPNQQR
jgi:hypothetical protein